MISPFPQQNATNIHLKELVEGFKKFAGTMDINRLDMKLPFMTAVKIQAFGPMFVPGVMENTQVKALLADKSAAFDLIVMETFGTDALYGLGEHFKAPVIAVFPTAPSGIVNLAVGNPEDPSYVPSLYLSYTPDMTLYQRVLNYGMAFLDFLSTQGYGHYTQSKLYTKYFPNNKKTFREVIREDVALAFVNTHFSLSFPRPYVPNMIEVGGINIDRSVGELPKDFKNILDNAKAGAIVFSMGSFLQASDFNEQQRKAVIGALGKLKQTVIWRYNLPDSDQLPKNIFPREWLPQKEILAHPNVKLFITHGGMLGTTESIYHGVPMIGIPVFGDQHLNIARAVKRGYALPLDLNKLTEERILSAVNEILSNPKYKEQVQSLSKIFRDQPMTAQERVLYWSEYVMRHKGAPHMQVEAQNLGFIAYHGLDVLAIFVLAFLLFVVTPNYLLLKWVLKKFCKCSQRNNVKVKTK